MAKLAILSPTYFLMSIAMQICIATSYNVLDFGAVPDGETDSTPAFTKAWAAACSSNKESTVVVPRGTFFVNSISFDGPCKNEIRFRIMGTIVAPSDYRLLSDHQSWLRFYRVSRVSVLGGRIDAKGSSYWSCKNGGKSICPYNARSIALQSSDRVQISGLTSLNSQGVHIHINGCNNVTLQNLKLIAPAESPNTDGIHIGNSRLVRVLNSTISTGDDCISIGPGSTDMRIERIKCGPGHGISIGSMGGGGPREDGVEHVVVKDSVFTNTDNGVRIKTWAKPSNTYVRDIVFKNLQMKNVANPIIIDQEYCPAKNCPKASSGVQVSDVTFDNIKGTSRTQEAIMLLCSSKKPCAVKLQDINLKYTSQLVKMKMPAISNCQNAKVTRVGLVFPKC